MNYLLNDVVLSQDIVDAFFSMDENIVKACDEKATQICIKLFPDVDLSREENIELVIRPMSAVIALNELMLQNLFEISSIDGVYSSKTLPDKLKIPVLRNYATLNGIQTVSNDVDSLFSEIKFGLKSKNLNLATNIRRTIEEKLPEINRLMFIESDMEEMDRNKLSYIQINHIDAMNFERTQNNSATLINTAYNRSDYQRYIEYIKSDKIEFPGTLDIYFSTQIEKEIITVEKDSNDLFNFDSGYYIYIKSTSKDYVLLENDSRKWGIVKTTPSIYVTDSEQTEEFEVLRYKFIDFSDTIDVDDLTVIDVMYKCFFPIFVDFTVYTEDYSVNNARILESISQYLETVSGDISMISHNDMNDYVRKNGDNVVISSTNPATGYSAMNLEYTTNMTFPITMKDIRMPVEIKKASMSGRTIKVFARSVNVIKE